MEQIENISKEIIDKLDTIARDYDSHDYGLPIGVGRIEEEMSVVTFNSIYNSKMSEDMKDLLEFLYVLEPQITKSLNEKEIKSLKDKIKKLDWLIK